MLFHCNNGHTNAPPYYVIYTASLVNNILIFPGGIYCLLLGRILPKAVLRGPQPTKAVQHLDPSLHKPGLWVM